MRIAIIEDETMMLEHVTPIIAGMAGAPMVRGYGLLEQFFRDGKTDGPFDLVLLDLGLPDSEGIDTLRRFRKQCSDVPVVVFSGKFDPKTILEAIDEGAMGFVPKRARTGLLRPALELVLAGGVYLPPEALSGVRSLVGDANGQGDDETTQSIFALTRRQRDVLMLLIKGLPNKLICRALNLSGDTVKSHLHAIFRVLDVSNRTQAVLAAQRMGLRVKYDEHKPTAI